jgi:hypothetical protein
MNDQQSPGPGQRAYEEAQEQRKQKRNGNGCVNENGAERPTIKIADGHLLEIMKQAEQAILASKEIRIFQRGGLLVRIKRIPKKTTTRGITRATNSLMIDPATPDNLRCEMARTATYMRYNERAKEWKRTDCPLKYAKSIAALNEWSFKPLLGTIETPTLRADGSILQTPGYDEVSGLFYDSNGMHFPTISNKPSKEEADKAS